MIVFDSEQRRLMDRATGEYLSSQSRDPEAGEVWYTIRSAEGVAVVTGLVLRDAPGPPGAPGATEVRYRLKEAFVPTGAHSPPHYLLGPHPLVERLRLFLLASIRSSWPTVPVSFVDERASSLP